jgi:hypothetical protein
LIGYLSAASNAPYIVWIVAVAVPLAVAVAVLWAVAVAVFWAVAVVWAVAVPLAVAVAVAVFWAGYELRKSFSKVHTFIILASTSSLGLGLGWLGHKIFNPGS